jgi:hypothetical protein
MKHFYLLPTWAALVTRVVLPYSLIAAALVLAG